VEESAQAMDAVAGLKRDECRPMLLSYTLDAGGSFRDQVDVTEGIRQILKVAQEKKIECTYWHDILRSR
jgi:hypothetical protein